MQDGNESNIWGDRRGPWHEVTDESRLYDSGQPWCAQADGHPPADGDGYPNPDRHLVGECRTRSLHIAGVREGLAGERWNLEVYGADAFRYGQLRDDAHGPSPRAVMELWRDAGEYRDVRYSLSVGDALRLRRWIDLIVESVDG